MNNDDYLFKEINRELLLLSSAKKKEREKLLDNIQKNVNKLKRIWKGGLK